LLNYELGDVVLWLAFDDEAPFPLNIYRANGVWTYQIHTELEEYKVTAIEAFAKARIKELENLYKEHMNKCLTFKRKKRKR
jgi:hypothetical protein